MLRTFGALPRWLVGTYGVAIGYDIWLTLG